MKQTIRYEFIMTVLSKGTTAVLYNNADATALLSRLRLSKETTATLFNNPVATALLSRLRLSKETTATLFNNAVVTASLSRLRLSKETTATLFNNTATTALLARLCLIFVLLVSFSPQPSFANTDNFQRYILTIEPHAMEQDLSPLIAEFGDPAAAKIQALAALNMVIVSVPTSWQLAKGAFCQRAMQVPTIKHCIADFPIQLQQSQSSAALNTELTNYNQCKPWYLDANTCPGTTPSPTNVQAAEAWTYTTGSDDVVVAVLDSGFDFSFPNFADNIWHNTAEVTGQDGIDDDNNGYVDDKYGWDVAADPQDGLPANTPCLPDDEALSDRFNVNDRNHGTHVAQFIAGTNQGRHVAGVAWQTQLMSVRIAGCSTIIQLFFNVLLQAINYIVANKQNGINVRVINVSYFVYVADEQAAEEFSVMINRILSILATHDIIFVSVAGNDSVRLLDRQSTALNLIGVGGVNSSGGWVYNWHPVHIDLAAPALDLPVYYGSQDSLMAIRDGTSFAAPQVAGALALLYAYRPNFTYQQARAALLAGVTVLPGLQGRNATSGTLNLTRMFEQLPGLAVDFPDQQRQVMEGSSLDLTVRLTHVANVQRPVRVPVTVRVEDSSGASAAASISPNRFTLTDDRPSQQLTLSAAIRDGNFRRGIFLRLRADDNASSEYAGVTRNIPIEVIDRPTIAFAAPRNITLMEGESAQLIITATPALPEDIAVDLQFDSGDIEVSPKLITLRAGQTSITATVTVRDDGLAERDERLSVRLSLADSQVLAKTNAANNQITITVPAHDLPIIAFAAPSTITLMEGESTQLTITAMPALPEDIAVGWQFDGNDIEVHPNPTTLRAGQSSVTATVTARDDNLAEPDERLSVRLHLADPQAAAHIDGARNQTIVTVLANDPLIIAFAAPRNITLTEGDSAQLIITATSIPPEDIAVGLQFDGNDIEVNPNPTTLRAGQSSATATVIARDDNLAEPDERLSVRLNLADPHTLAHIDGARNQTTVTILANDPLIIAFAAPRNITLTEGDSAQLIITATSVPPEDITVGLQFGSNDISISPNPVTLRAGQTSIAATVTARDDNVPERDERLSVRLNLVDPHPLTKTDKARSQATVTIPANDLPTIAFAAPSTITLMAGASTQLIITARPALQEDITVGLQLDSNDIEVSPNPITIRAGQTITAVTVAISDQVPPQVKELNIRLGLTDPQVLAQIDENNNEATITIIQSSIRLRIKVYLEGAL